MSLRFDFSEQRTLLLTVVRWGGLGSLLGVLCGIASAVFLYTLNAATAFRETHPWLLFLLPIGGLLVAWVYDHWGKPVAAGNNLLLETIHSEGEMPMPVPFRMAPLVFFGTVVTHFFGGSAGREGTAVQMGGAFASLLAQPLRLNARDHRLLLMAGISGGFGAVFGTPLAGTVFGLEVLAIGSLRYEALVACFTAATMGDVTCRALGITHHVYTVGELPQQTPLLWISIIGAAFLFAGAATIFAELTHGISQFVQKQIKNPLLRPVFGAVIVIALTYLVGTRDYLGLSLPLLERSFTPVGVALGAFALKILFTTITLGTDFKGGEVTPLFVIGASLGSAFADITGQSTGFFAALGFVGIFAGAANTPLACTLMGIELFGGEMAVPLMAVCVLSYILSGHRGIYLAQRIVVSKSHDIVVGNGATLRDSQ